MKIKKVNLGMFLLLGFLVVNLPVGVYGSGGHEENAVEVDDSTMLSPIWHKILKTQKELSETVESGKLETVHKFAFAIRDLSKELLKRTTDEDLSEEQMNNVKATVERIAEVAAALDEYGDGGDQANTEKYLKKMNSLIDFVDMQYADSLKDDLYHAEEGEDEYHEEESGHPAEGQHHDE